MQLLISSVVTCIPIFMQIFRFVSQMGFIQLQQSYKVDKVLICAIKKKEKQTSKVNTQMPAFECVDTYHIYETPRKPILK